MNRPLVFLDIDNTVLDFNTAEEKALKRVFLENGLPADDAVIAHFRCINDDCWQRLETGELSRAQVLYGRFERLFREKGIAYADPVSVQDSYEIYLTGRHYFMPGAEDMLKSLYGQYRLFAVSNGNAETQAKRIASAKLQQWFEAFFISEKVGAEKPSKRFFDICFEQIQGIDRSAAVIVGDSLTSDIRGGINAGIPTVWFNYGYAPLPTDIRPDYIIHALAELPPLLDEHFGNIIGEKNV